MWPDPLTILALVVLTTGLGWCVWYELRHPYTPPVRKRVVLGYATRSMHPGGTIVFDGSTYVMGAHASVGMLLELDLDTGRVIPYRGNTRTDSSRYPGP